MRRVMNSFHFGDPDALLRGVAHPGDARDALLAELTVGESYFFREAAALSVLERDIIKAQRLAGRESEPLRIWSAGCATGEEPYTLAMLLRELGSTHDARILGTDISRPRLDAARRARYTQWSMRGVPPERIARWFEQRGKHYIVRADVRDAVRFLPLNLVADEYPSDANGTANQDLILCRNVLIYFDLPTVAQIAEKLLRALRPDGWLLLGASDPPLGDLVSCRMHMTPSGAIYQRTNGEPRTIMVRAAPDVTWPDVAPAGMAAFVALTDVEADVEPRPPRMVAVAAAIAPAVVDTSAALAYERGDYALAAREAERTLLAGHDAVPDWIIWIRSLANVGQLLAAGEVAAAAIDRHRLVPELHYLHGMLLLEGGCVAESVQATRRALYLDRTFVIARMLLGDGLARLGDIPAAQRAFASALSELDAMPEGAIVPAADGVSASRVRQIAAERLRGLTVLA